MLRSLLVVALLAVVPSCTVVGAATGYSLAGSHNTSGKDHESSGKATAAGAFIGLIVDAAIISAAASYEANHSSPVSFCTVGCGGY